jgi:hypothetical protein
MGGANHFPLDKYLPLPSKQCQDWNKASSSLQASWSKKKSLYLLLHCTMYKAYTHTRWFPCTKLVYRCSYSTITEFRSVQLGVQELRVWSICVRLRYARRCTRLQLPPFPAREMHVHQLNVTTENVYRRLAECSEDSLTLGRAPTFFENGSASA